MHRTLATALLIGVVGTGALAQTRPAVAQEKGAQQKGAQQDEPPQIAPDSEADALLRATIERLVETLGQVIETLPRYAPPEIDKDGNIILRRLNPPGRSPSPDLPPPGWTLDRTSA
jgi:hypothetical protein